MNCLQILSSPFTPAYLPVSTHNQQFPPQFRQHPPDPLNPNIYISCLTLTLRQLLHHFQLCVLLSLSCPTNLHCPPTTVSQHCTCGPVLTIRQPSQFLYPNTHPSNLFHTLLSSHSHRFQHNHSDQPVTFQSSLRAQYICSLPQTSTRPSASQIEGTPSGEVSLLLRIPALLAFAPAPPIPSFLNVAP